MANHEDSRTHEETSLIPKSLIRDPDNNGKPVRRISPILAIALAILLVPCAISLYALVIQNDRLNKTLAETRTLNTELDLQLFKNNSLLNDTQEALSKNKTALNAAENEIAEVRAERDRLNELVNEQAKMLDEQTVVIDALEAANARLEAAYTEATKRLQWARVILKRFADMLLGMGFTEEEVSIVRYARDKKPVAKQWEPVVENLGWKVWVATRCIEERPDRELHPEPKKEETKPEAQNAGSAIETVETAETPVLTIILPVSDHDMAEIAVSYTESDSEPEPEALSRICGALSHTCGILSHISEAPSVIASLKTGSTEPLRDALLFRDVGHAESTVRESTWHHRGRDPDHVDTDTMATDLAKRETVGKRQKPDKNQRRRPGIVAPIARSDSHGHLIKEPLNPRERRSRPPSESIHTF